MVAYYQGSFNAGELSPRIDGQVTLERRAAGVGYLLNMIALKQGPIERRGATVYIAPTKHMGRRAEMLSFEYDISSAFQIECGHQYFRFFKERSHVMSGGVPYEVESPYIEDDLYDSEGVFRLGHKQVANVTFLVHGKYRPRTLARIADDNWSLTTLAFFDGPYDNINTTSTTLTPSGTSGSITMTASSVTGINRGQGFLPSDVDRLIRFRDSASKWTWMRITAVTSTTVVTATVVGPNLATTTGTTNWRLGVFCTTYGWPEVIAFHQGRVWLAGGTLFPDSVFASQSGGFSPTDLRFAETNAEGEVADDNAFRVDLFSDQVNRVAWMLSDHKGLLVGTATEEWVVSGTSVAVVVTPSNKSATPMSKVGAYPIPAVRADTGVIFTQRARRRLFDVVYNFEQDIQKPRDISVFADHLFCEGVRQVVYYQEPYNVLACVMDDGTMRFMTYYPDQNVFGASRIEISGVSDAEGSPTKVESVCVTISPDACRSEMVLICKRYVNGQVRRYVEYLEAGLGRSLEADKAVYLDCAKVHFGSPITTMTGLEHLEGEEVSFLLDGKASPKKVVSGGEVSFPEASNVVVGLPTRWAVETLRPEFPTESNQTSIQTIVRAHRAVVRVFRSLAMFVGFEDERDEYTFFSENPFGNATPLFSGDTAPIALPTRHTREGRIRFEHDGPFPMTIISLRLEGRANE